MARSALRIVLSQPVLPAKAFAAQCALARALDYDGLQLAPFPAGVDYALSDSEAAILRDAALAEGLRIEAVHVQLPPGLTLAAEDGKARDAIVSLQARACELAALCGARLVSHSAAPGATVQPGDAAWQAVAQALAEAGRLARSSGVLYAVSPGAMGVAVDTRDAVRMLDTIQDAALRLTFDSSEAERMETGLVEAVLAEYTPLEYIVHVQLQGPAAGGGGGSDVVGPLLRALLQMCDFGNFSGVVALHADQPQPDAATGAARSIGFVHGVLQGLRA